MADDFLFPVLRQAFSVSGNSRAKLSNYLKVIITDPSKKPSERFIEIVGIFFNDNGYIFKKASNEFVRANADGFEKVKLSFYISTLVSVSFWWTKSFLGLEKTVAFINGQPRKYKSEVTLFSDLMNYSLRKKDNEVFSLDLYDKQTLKHDDFVLNKAAKKVIELYEKYTVPFFNSYSSYQAIEHALNTLPITSTDLTPFTNKRILYGIVLAKYVNSSNFWEIVEGYKEYLNGMSEGTKTEMLEKIDITLRFLDKNNIQTALIA